LLEIVVTLVLIGLATALVAPTFRRDALPDDGYPAVVSAARELAVRRAQRLVLDVDDRGQVDPPVLSGNARVQRTHGTGTDQRDAQPRAVSITVRAGSRRCCQAARHRWSSTLCRSACALRPADDKVPLLCRQRDQPRPPTPELRRADRPGTRT